MLFLSTITLALLASHTTASPTPHTKRGIFGYDVSGVEFAYCAIPTHVSDCIDIYADAGIANDAAIANFAASTLQNGVGDAFRHCYWSALMTIDVGEDVAETFGTLHEDGAEGQTPEGRAMDLANNAFGRQVGWWAENQGGTAQQIRDRALTQCREAAQAGELTTVD